MRTAYLRCHKGASTAPTFTDGRVYVGSAPDDHPGAGFTVRDDGGALRYVIPGGTCPHLPPPLRDFGPGAAQALGGWFEVVPRG